MVEQAVAEDFIEFKVYYLLFHPLVQLLLALAVLWVREIHPMLDSLPTEEMVERHHSTEARAKHPVEKEGTELSQTQLQSLPQQMAEMVELALENWQEEVHLVAQLGLLLQRDRELLGQMEQMVRGLGTSDKEEAEAPGE
jgi:hypothetical protein